MNDEFAVPNLIKTYREDFGGSDQCIIEFVYGYLENPDISLNQAIKDVKDQKLWIVSEQDT